MNNSLKIAIPMAGLGTRMRPHTWSKPKPLIALAGQTVLDHLLEQFRSLPQPDEAQFIFIVGSQPAGADPQPHAGTPSTDAG